MSVNDPAVRGELLMTFVRNAAEQAEAILVRPGQEVRLRAIGDDGLSEIARLELSPILEDQFLAVALRLSGDGARRCSIFAALEDHFRMPPPSIAIEAQRKLVLGGADGTTPSSEMADEAMRAMEQKIASKANERVDVLSVRAAFYSELWCDPRIPAGPSTRRVIRAMADIMNSRANSNQVTRR